MERARRAYHQHSHVAAALARAALTLDPGHRPRAAELICRFVAMLVDVGDQVRPNAHEHYNRLTGAANLYRGIDDHQHSFVVDLIIRYLVGLQPCSGERLALDRFPSTSRRCE